MWVSAIFQMRSFPFPIMPRGTFVFFARVPVREVSVGRNKSGSVAGRFIAQFCQLLDLV